MIIDKFALAVDKTSEDLLCPYKVVLNFDPRKSENKNFQDELYLIIWCCISYRHIRDQYFANDVKDFVDLLRLEMPSTYKEFKKWVNSSPLSRFGKRQDPKSKSIMFHTMILCDEFWYQVWLYVKKVLYGDELQMNLFGDECDELEIVIN